MPDQSILFILVDQWPALSFGHRGAPISTPHTDRLASEGTVFTNAFTTCPLCSPARGALLTARWPHETGMLDNVGVGYSFQGPLVEDEVTWIDAAVRAGYHVGYFGKWHLGPDGPIARGAHRHSPTFDPHAKPYDASTSDYTYEHMTQQYAAQTEQLIEGRAPFWGVTDQAVDDTAPMRLAANTDRFLREHAQSGQDQPFFLTTSIAPPHFPHHLPREYAERVDVDAVELPASIGDTFAGRPDFHAQPWWPCMDTSVLD
ncbi:MAG TPA: sulfatase-like hydrolase/transferase, partial [Armatimonadota bacterium]|nr:sulfatase-like hydrolase/transferase [Armatimonadota bacterium]